MVKYGIVNRTLTIGYEFIFLSIYFWRIFLELAMGDIFGQWIKIHFFGTIYFWSTSGWQSFL